MPVVSDRANRTEGTMPDERTSGVTEWTRAVEFDTARIARELARLGKAGAEPELALVRVIQGTHARLRDGMTHAYAAAEAWLRLRDSLAGETLRLACAVEALVYIAFDTLRE